MFNNTINLGRLQNFKKISSTRNMVKVFLFYRYFRDVTHVVGYSVRVIVLKKPFLFVSGYLLPYNKKPQDQLRTCT
jgi:hypothetical protein